MNVLSVTERPNSASDATPSQSGDLPAVYDAVRVGLCVIDQDLRVISTNRCMAHFTDGLVGASIGRVLAEIMPDISGQLEPQLRQALQSKPATNGEARSMEAEVARSGQVFQVCLEPLRREDGIVDRVLCCFVDITERKQAEAALRESERQAHAQRAIIEAVYAAAPVGLAFHDRDLRYVAVNDRFAALSGHSAAASIGKTSRELLGPGLADSVEKLQRRVLETGLPVESLEIHTATPSSPGDERTFVAGFRPVRDAAESILGVIVAVLETTERSWAEAALAESEAAFRRLFHSNPAPMWVYDRDTLRFLAVNDAAVEVYGWSRDAFLGMTILDIRPPEEREAVRRAAMEPRSTRKVSGPWRHLDAARRERLVDAISHLIEFAGRPGVLVTAWDVTDRVRSEQALRESEENYRYTIELSPQIHWTADPKGNVLQVGPRWYAVTGTTAERALGTTWAQAVHPADLTETTRAWSYSLQTGEPLDIEYRLRLANGKHRWFRARAAARRDDSGCIVRWYGLLEDIHDRRLSEMALRESEMRFRSMSDESPVMIWLTDASGVCTFLNRLWHETTGQTVAEGLGFGWLQAVHAEDRARVDEAFTAAMVRQERYRCEFRLRRADGGWAWVIDAAHPRFAADGTFLGHLGSAIDITDRRMAEAALRESEAFARSVLESSPDNIRVLDLDGRLLFMNEAGCRMLEVEDYNHLIGADWRAFPFADDIAQLEWGLAEARAGRTARFNARRLNSSGTEQWLEASLSSVPDAEGRPVRLLSVSRDITEARLARQEADQARREAEHAAASLAAVLETTMDSVVVLDREWCVTYLNKNASRMLAARGLQVGSNLWEVYPEEAEGTFARHYRQVIAEQKAVSFEEYLPVLDKWLEVQACPAPEGLSIFFRDITERRRAEQERMLAQEKILQMARHDALTGLPNRTFFRERVERELASQDATKQTAILYLDLDGFKAVNDTLGHPAGDALLKMASERLQKCVRGSDMVARFGGDEFVILQTGIAGPFDAETLAGRILEALAEPFSLTAQYVSVGTSIGIAIAHGGEADPDGLLKSADIALYCAKGEGRGTYRFFDPSMDRHLRERQAIKLALHGALKRKEFELHYQPLVDLTTGRLTTFEALMRWRHPERGMISPAQFIPVAEETGMIVQIGEWALLEACRCASEWPVPISVAVNLSPVQFKSRTLASAVKNALTKSQLEPQRLQLEITESVLLQDNNLNLGVLQELRRLGVRIAMDDFGTGYSSLGYLRSFPFDKIKLDQSFVRDLPQAAECLAIVQAVAGLAAGLGVTTTAEGIETRDQLDILRASGYNEGQGYFFGKPLHGSEVLQVIEGYCQSGDGLYQVSESVTR